MSAKIPFRSARPFRASHSARIRFKRDRNVDSLIFPNFELYASCTLDGKMLSTCPLSTKFLSNNACSESNAGGGGIVCSCLWRTCTVFCFLLLLHNWNVVIQRSLIYEMKLRSFMELLIYIIFSIRNGRYTFIYLKLLQHNFKPWFKFLNFELLSRLFVTVSHIETVINRVRSQTLRFMFNVNCARHEDLIKTWA